MDKRMSTIECKLLLCWRERHAHAHTDTRRERVEREREGGGYRLKNRER